MCDLWCLAFSHYAKCMYAKYTTLSVPCTNTLQYTSVLDSFYGCTVLHSMDIPHILLINVTTDEH